jgi:hypothetical protein
MPLLHEERGDPRRTRVGAQVGHLKQALSGWWQRAEAIAQLLADRRDLFGARRRTEPSIEIESLPGIGNVRLGKMRGDGEIDDRRPRRARHRSSITFCASPLYRFSKEL